MKFSKQNTIKPGTSSMHLTECLVSVALWVACHINDFPLRLCGLSWNIFLTVVRWQYWLHFKWKHATYDSTRDKTDLIKEPLKVKAPLREVQFEFKDLRFGIEIFLSKNFRNLIMKRLKSQQQSYFCCSLIYKGLPQQVAPPCLIWQSFLYRMKSCLLPGPNWDLLLFASQMCIDDVHV